MLTRGGWLKTRELPPAEEGRTAVQVTSECESASLGSLALESSLTLCRVGGHQASGL